MNKKLILLILCLPIILMLSLFSVSSSVTLSINIPVTKIEIFGDKVIYLDLDSQEKYFINYTVYPTNAQNKEVYLETEQVGTSILADLEFKDGYLIPKSCGKAKVYLTTIDGGFKDSFIVQVDSNKLQGIQCSTSTSSIYVGDSVQIETAFYPENTVYTTLKYTVAEQYSNIVSVDASGIVSGITKGVAEIVVTSDVFPEITDVVTIEVKNKDIIDFEKTEITTWEKEHWVTISLDTLENCNYTCNAYNENGELLNSSIVEVSLDLSQESNGIILLNYNIKNKTDNRPIILEVKAETESGLVVTKTCTLSYVDNISAEFLNKKTCSVMVTTTNLEEPITAFQPFKVTPSNADVGFRYSLTNEENVSVSIDSKNKAVYIVGNKIGVSRLTLIVYNNSNPEETVEIYKDIVVKPQGITIDQTGEAPGIEKLFAFGRTDINDLPSEYNLTLSHGNGEVGNGFYENIFWKSSSPNALIDNDGKITLDAKEGNEIVNFTAVYSFGDVTVESEPYQVKCVYDGINVNNYKDLWTATNLETPKPIILQADIEKDFAQGLDTFYKEITTTYDKTYYKNMGILDKAKIKVLIEFKADVYGNGHTINAHNVAWDKNQQNALTKAVFNGPLDFVALSESGGAVRVKGQDNVCFAVYEDVTITNIILKGCNLEPDPTTKKLNLDDLTYTGTTIEVFGDNVNIKYSRISNGRTVIRAFGDIKDSTQTIKLNIENCVIRGAREFLLRLGTNCFVDGTKENPSPYLPNDNIQTFPVQKSYKSMTAEEKAEYDKNFIKTFVNVKNSVFQDAGIFAIGLDSHFAGPALADGSSFSSFLFKGWHDLAKTSYGVKLTFEGDVRMYNWKKLSDVNSSTLIEKPDSLFPEISFDVKEMVDKISENEKFKNVVYLDPETQTKYVHAGIAFFGGGKNYSVFEDKDFVAFDDKDYTISYDFKAYEIKLSDVDKELLEAAAGSESFYFLINDATSTNFLPPNQQEMLASQGADSNINK